MDKNVARFLLSHKTEDTIGVVPITSGWATIPSCGKSFVREVIAPSISFERSRKAVDTDRYFDYHSWEVIEYESRTRWYEKLSIWLGEK